jgi:hypothetical protein
VKQTVQKSSDRQRAIAARGVAQRKKLAVAFLLFFVMAILWVRVFVGKGGPKTASAITDINTIGTAAESAALKVVYTELPVISKRHDVLANDFFTSRDFRGFRKQGESALDSDVNMSGAGDLQLSGDLAAAAEELELTAIVNDKKPQAFIGDRLLEKNQSFRFVFRGQAYDFKVVNILENRVELECNGVIITKKIPEILFKNE